MYKKKKSPTESVTAGAPLFHPNLLGQSTPAEVLQNTMSCYLYYEFFFSYTYNIYIYIEIYIYPPENNIHFNIQARDFYGKDESGWEILACNEHCVSFWQHARSGQHSSSGRRGSGPTWIGPIARLPEDAACGVVGDGCTEHWLLLYYKFIHILSKIAPTSTKPSFGVTGNSVKKMGRFWRWTHMFRNLCDVK